jgi:xylulokinase
LARCLNYDGLGRPFNFGCRTNGALAWDQLRTRHGLGAKDYAACDAALGAAVAGPVALVPEAAFERLRVNPSS